ncbi:MAG: lipoate--protein ligase family protein [Ilumatobacter sp.]|nr:MAG: lipoate--protein ligase family protein [Ilumatobacter sp.]
MPRPPREVHVERSTGSAVAFHARDLPTGEDLGGHLVVWDFVVDRPAVVLGSQQRTDVLDLEACGSAGVEVAHRRSGGGLVHLVPGEVLWVDVIVPTDHPSSTSDIRGSMVWMGERWAAALAHLGLTAGIAVHRGGMVASSWSDLICFAGIGPGEVLLDGHKLVGISQRRTRSAARFQCAVHLHADPTRVLPLLAAPLPPIDELPAVSVLAADPAGRLVDALVDELAV